MTVSVDIAVDNSSVLAKLQKMDTGFSATAWSGFLGTTVGPYLRQRMRGRFSQEGDDVSGPWAPLRESTKRIRVTQGYSEGPINHRSGEMEDFLVNNNGLFMPMGPIAVLTYPSDPPGIELKKKIKTAQQGQASPKTVARPVIGLNQNDAIFIIAAMSFYAQQVIN
jgi:hypothetical protein